MATNVCGLCGHIGIYLRHCLNGDQDKFDLIWPSVFTIAVIKRKRPSVVGEVDGAIEKNKRV